MNDEFQFPYKLASEVSTGVLQTEEPRIVGPVVRDQNGQQITWGEFVRRIHDTIERHEREHPDCKRPVFTIDHRHADGGKQS